MEKQGKSHKPLILVADDIPENVDILFWTLREDYDVRIACDGSRALEVAGSQPPPDLILLDIMMPDLSGYEVCRRLKKSALTRKIPVIFVSSMEEDIDEKRGFEMGAVDYIHKPISPSIVQARVRTHLLLYDQNQLLEEKVRERTRELLITRDATIFSLCILAEYRDNETGAHIMRTQRYVQALARELVTHLEFKECLDEEMIETLYKSAPLHDIGKVGVPDKILLKPGRLTPEEFEEMKKHTLKGHEAIAKAEEVLGSDNKKSFLRFAREIALSHHEKWDGSGYPQGLAGKAIPVPARLMALADVYDALISRRVYKPAFTHEEAEKIIFKGRGNHFDPDIVDAYQKIEGEFRRIALEFSDNGDSRNVISFPFDGSTRAQKS